MDITIKAPNIFLLSANPVIQSSCLLVLHTFVLRPLWHPENKCLAKLHHKSLSPSESCEATRHLREILHLLLGLSKMLLSALINKGRRDVFQFHWLCLDHTCTQHRLMLASRKIIHEFSIAKFLHKSGSYWVSLISAKKVSCCLMTIKFCIQSIQTFHTSKTKNHHSGKQKERESKTRGRG